MESLVSKCEVCEDECAVMHVCLGKLMFSRNVSRQSRKAEIQKERTEVLQG